MTAKCSCYFVPVLFSAAAPADAEKPKGVRALAEIPVSKADKPNVSELSHVKLNSRFLDECLMCLFLVHILVFFFFLILIRRLLQISSQMRAPCGELATTRSTRSLPVPTAPQTSPCWLSLSPRHSLAKPLSAATSSRTEVRGAKPAAYSSRSLRTCLI